MAGDWMALALERFQNTSRSVRLTLPPGRHEKFWDRLVELALHKRQGLAITLLLPADPRRAEALAHALRALPALERSGHEVAWSAADPLPFHLFVMDDLWALVIAGDPDGESGASYVHLTDVAEEARPLRDAFDRRVASGIWGPDPRAWLTWLEQVTHKKTTRGAIASLNRGSRRLRRAVGRELRRLPTRGFWLMKPRDRAWGLPDLPGVFHWGQWVLSGRVGLGLPELAGELAEAKLPGRDAFRRMLKKHYPALRHPARLYAMVRHFLVHMRPGDRIAAIEGWTARQEAPVHFHGWARVESDPRLEKVDKGWPVVREAEWHRYDVELPVDLVRAATGLDASSHPIHRIEGPPFRALVDLAEQVRRSNGRKQMSLDLAMINAAGQQTLL